MSYSITLWLIDPGKQVREPEGPTHMGSDHRNDLPDASSETNEPSCATQLVYGMYSTQIEAAEALEVVAEQLVSGRPLLIPSRGNRVFLVPTLRVHYAVMAEVSQPANTAALPS